MHPVVASVPIRTAAVVDLNVVRVRLATNLESFPAYGYFAEVGPDDGRYDYEVVCIDQDRDPVDLEAVAAQVDRTFRGKRFRAGYYLVHYFGEPAYLITNGRRFLVVGRQLERTVWPYFVKHILTVHSADAGLLHLKAGGFVQDDGDATLLVGRNGGGKTVFLVQACLAGASFLTNTHALVADDATVYGVPSSLRVRRDRQFADLIDRYDLPRHMEAGDHIARPEQLFGDRGARQGRLRNLVVVDYNPAQPDSFERVAGESVLTFLDQFAFAVTTYGLKDDLFVHYGTDFDAFTAGLAAMKERLRAMVRSARCYRANVDLLDAPTRDRVLAELAAR
ncbi:FomB family phosphonate monophosphate kinase [Micromonospora cathayae]|uniref:FomB family phosphonate monophosphate kinase n=1 Tax=Micromonospora cathayae TaxID=3028804 RepID=A0ABY7ZTL6_9ACTN|nr:FomB family phosphonate monophosphate kinase [Micromonospora sp. HUAS 3]WDZ85833.1 FomB family phosphonate monophosphate kinase [Micromonospora sp. HUAS 3]